MMLNKSRKGKFIHNTSCYECGSSNAKAVYTDGAYCFVCVKSYNLTEKENEQMQTSTNAVSLTPQTQQQPKGPAKGSQPIDLVDRKISKQTLERYGVTLEYDASGKVVSHFYPYTMQGEHVATKIRVLPKEFKTSGPINNTQLFGQSLVPQGGKFVTLCEGEIDAMSFLEMEGFPALSVKSATSAVKDCKDQWKYLNTFEKIVLAFDKDKDRVDANGKTYNPGKDAADAVAKLFEPGKVLIMDMGEYKDANDFLVSGKFKEFKKAWWNAKPYTPDSIVNGASLWDLVMEEKHVESVPYPYAGLNKKTYGLRKSELVVVTAGTGVGKSTFCKALAWHLKQSIKDDECIGMLMIEESTRETALSMMSIAGGKAFHLPDTEFTVEEKRKAYEDVLGDGKVYLQADKMFAYSDIDGIMSTIQYMSNALNCKYIVLDHISIITSSGENGDERRALDEIVTKLKSLTMQLNICLIIVCHLKRLAGTPAEQGAQITLNDLRGTHGIGQLSNIILALERDGQAPDAELANTINVRVLKNRFCGRLGIACTIVFNDKTQQFTEIFNSADTEDTSIDRGETV